MQEWQERIEERLTKVEQQQTEPIKITRLEIDQGGMHKRLDSVQENTNILKIEMAGARADISNIKATQSDHNVFHIEHGQRLKTIEDKQDAHTEILGQLVNLSESHSKHFDQIETTMATKDDIAALKATQAEQGKMLAEQGEVLRELLRRLPPQH